MANALSEPLRAYGHRVTELVASAERRRPDGRVDGALRACWRPTRTRPPGSPTGSWRPGGTGPGSTDDRAGSDRGASTGRSTAVLVRTRKQIAPIERALRDRGPAGRGGRPRRPAGHARGPRRGEHPAGARRPAGRRGAAAAADRRRAGGSARATWSRSTAGRGHCCTAGASGGIRRDAEAAAEQPAADPGPARRGGADRRAGRPRARRSATRPRGTGGSPRSAPSCAACAQRLDQPLPDLVADIEREMGLDVEVVGARRGHRPGPRPPGRVRRDRGPVRDRDAGRDAVGVPRVPGRRRVGGARPRRRRGRHRRRRGADPDRARRQGPGVGHRRGRRPDQGRVPGPDHGRPTTTSAASACCRSRCAATAPACPSFDVARGGDQQAEVRDALRPVRRRLAGARRARGAAAGVRRGDPPAPAAAVLRLLVGEGTVKPRGPSVFLDDVRDGVPGRRRRRSTSGRRRRPTTRRTRRSATVVRGELAARPARRPRGRRSSTPPRWSGRPATVPAGHGARAGDGRRGRSAGRTRWICCSPSGPGRPGPGRSRSRWRCPRSCRCRTWSRCGTIPAAWPAGCAGRCRERPDPYARRGTAFHRWLEQRFGADQLLDLDELPGAGDEDAAADEALDRAAGAVPGRASGPSARRSRSRCRSRPRSPAW